MKKTIVLSVLAASLAGCQSAPSMEKSLLDKKVSLQVESTQQSVEPSMILRTGETLASAFRGMGMIDKHTYIVEGDALVPLPGVSSAIFTREDLARYFQAYGMTVKFNPVEGSNYIRAKVVANKGAAKAIAATNCMVALSGSVPIGAAISDIARQAKIDVSYSDTGATSYAGVFYPVGYRGSCAGALEYLGQKADLAVVFNDIGVEYKMMDTATIDLGIPLRDRKIAMDIIADGKVGASTSGGNTSSANGGTGTQPGTGNSGGGSKSLQSTYMTNYFNSIKLVMESMKTPFGSWNYIPETGQIFVRDKTEAVSAVKASLNRLAQAFQSRFEVTLTLYRMTVNKNRQISGSIAGVINKQLAATFGSAAALAQTTGSITYNSGVPGAVGSATGIVQLLSTWGNIETLDSFSLTLQSGILQTLKVANNTEYVRNVSTTTNGNAGAVTASVEQANATDGSFISMQARQAEAGKIAVDYGAFINRLDGFDLTTTQTSVVKSQRGFERTFDSMAIVDDGVPYVASIVSQKSRNDTQSTLPGLENAGLFGALFGGNRVDSSVQTYIVVLLEAHRQ